MSTPLGPDRLGERLAEVYLVLGPLYRRVQRRVELDEAVTGMSVGVRAVLDELTRSAPATVPVLTERLELSRQFVQRMVDDALAAGWVERRDNPAHRRSSYLVLTAAGESAIAAVVRREHELMAQVPGDLTDDDVETTLRVLRCMRAGVDALDRAHDEEPT